MKTILLHVAISATVVLALCQQDARSQPTATTSNILTSGGMHKVTFGSAAGTITVYLPDDMAAGDTISGTVIAEPRGSTDVERSKNQDTLNGTVIDLGDGQKIKPTQGSFSCMIKSAGSAALKLTPVYPNGGGQSVSVPLVRASVPPALFQVPTMGQAGRPLTITGPFDGDASNTRCSVGGVTAIVVAESPRQGIFMSPSSFIGPSTIDIHERSSEVSRPFRNIGVNLTAPKTNLMRGENTTVTVTVSGLQGITTSVPLSLTTVGTVNMQGGNQQNIRIDPSQVNAAGTFTQSFQMSAVQTGGFSVTGTVLVGNPADPNDKCKCKCEFAKTPIVSAGTKQIEGGTQYSFAPNMKVADCTGNRCSVSKIDYSWSIGAASTATYSVVGGKASKELTVDVTGKGTLVLTVTVTVTCSDGTTCTATASQTITVKP